MKEEIAAEAVIQNMPAFAEFLRVAALTSGELLNYTNVGRETGVSAKAVRNYFQILEDTLLGFRVPPWRKKKKRMNVAIEVKGSEKIHRGHTKGLKALLEEQTIDLAIIVSLEKQPRKLDPSIEVLPWRVFLETLWSGGLGLKEDFRPPESTFH